MYTLTVNTNSRMCPWPHPTWSKHIRPTNLHLLFSYNLTHESIVPSCFYSVQAFPQQEQHDEVFPSFYFFPSPFHAHAPSTPFLAPSPWLAQQPNLQHSAPPSVALFSLVPDLLQSEPALSPYLLSCQSQHKVVLDLTQATVHHEAHARSPELQLPFYTAQRECKCQQQNKILLQIYSDSIILTVK